MWAVVAPPLPEEPPKTKVDRPRVPDQVVLRGIVFVLRTGMLWEMLLREVFGFSGMTLLVAAAGLAAGGCMGPDSLGALGVP